MMTTKIFNNGNSQAVRIPKEYRFEQEDVIISKIGSAVILYQRSDRLSVLMESLNDFTDAFLADGRPEQLPQTNREILD